MLVTAEGEAILAEFDNWPIPELRRQKLVWSGWGPFRVLPPSVDHSEIGDTGWGLRRLKDIDFKKLRLFFLSLLWRAAASEHPGFAEISLSAEELDELGSKLVDRDPGPPNYFSIHLNQLSTMGEAHNLTPIAQTKRIPPIEDVEEHFVPFFRIYLDGLIAHVHPNNEASYDGSKLGPLVLGQEEFATVATIKYEASFQRENLQILQSEAWRAWPELMTKL
ncbi:hypothetical protein [Bradyrhizobium sp. NAS80.1]|uniref:hypothetical protein n=1 Tax=Bradyrhizobium sp. NAS80.1 TaxID=1680159 RepID=UPI0009FC1A7C|nr:hypothetical protein [Bradyrhizobium sp. NAS80.1]